MDAEYIRSASQVAEDIRAFRDLVANTTKVVSSEDARKLDQLLQGLREADLHLLERRASSIEETANQMILCLQEGDFQSVTAAAKSVEIDVKNFYRRYSDLQPVLACLAEKIDELTDIASERKEISVRHKQTAADRRDNMLWLLDELCLYGDSAAAGAAELPSARNVVKLLGTAYAGLVSFALTAAPVAAPVAAAPPAACVGTNVLGALMILVGCYAALGISAVLLRALFLLGTHGLKILREWLCNLYDEQIPRHENAAETFQMHEEQLGCLSRKLHGLGESFAELLSSVEKLRETVSDVRESAESGQQLAGSGPRLAGLMRDRISGMGRSIEALMSGTEVMLQTIPVVRQHMLSFNGSSSSALPQPAATVNAIPTAEALGASSSAGGSASGENADGWVLLDNSSVPSDTSLSSNVLSLLSAADAGSRCFLPGTIFQLASGLYALVEHIDVNSRVVSASGSVIRVTRRQKHDADEQCPVQLVALTAGHATIPVSAMHRVSVGPGRTALAGGLRVGDQVLISGGVLETLTGVEMYMDAVDLYEMAFDPDEAVEAFMQPDAQILTLGEGDAAAAAAGASDRRSPIRRGGMSGRIMRQRAAADELASIPVTYDSWR